MSRFGEAKKAFDETMAAANELGESLVPVDGEPRTAIHIRGRDGELLEEYYKWQFVSALIHSGLYAKDYIGVEVRFPKGAKGSAALKLDGAVFDDKEWLEHYKRFWSAHSTEDLDWLNAHLAAVIEFKRGDKDIERVFSTQVKPAMRLKDPSDAYVLGIYYDTERLYLFHRRGGRFLRYDEAKNEKGERSQTGHLSLHLPDPYDFIPSFDELGSRIRGIQKADRTARGIEDLDTITSIATAQVRDAFSSVLRALDRAGLVNQRGYEIIIETFALKIFDEKRNQRNR
jgi:type I restriction enzyme M protein